MALIDHVTILSAQTWSNDAPSVAASKYNSAQALWESEMQNVEDRQEHSNDELFGEGFLTTPAITSSGSSLQITVGAFTCLNGAYVSYGGGTATLLASQTGASLYFQNDGTFSTTLPTTKTYFVFGTYTTTGSGVTTFTLSSKLLIPKLVTITGTVANIYVPDDVDYATGYVDHSATTLFAVDGSLKLTVSDTDAFTVEELYPGGMIDKDSNFLHNPPHQRTNGGFHYKLTRGAAYPYAADPTVTLTYTRTGMCIAT